MQLITIQELAKRLTVSLSSAYKLLSNGEIPFYKIASCLRVSEEDLQSYLEQQRQEVIHLPSSQKRHF